MVTRRGRQDFLQITPHNRDVKKPPPEIRRRRNIVPINRRIPVIRAYFCQVRFL